MPPWRTDDDTTDGGRWHVSTNTNNTFDTIQASFDEQQVRDINNLYENATQRGAAELITPASISFHSGGTQLERGVPEGAILLGTEHHDMITWYYDQLKADTDVQTTAEALAGELNEFSGLDAIKYELISRAQEEIEQLIDEGTAGDEAFNRATRSWPRELKGVLAAFEVQEVREDETYRDDVRRFATAVGTLDDNGDIDGFGEEQLPGDLVFPENPFDSEELSDEEAEMVIHVRLNGLDESELDFDRIEDADDFYWWLGETGDVETATNYHPFGQGSNAGLVTQFAPPSEWENMDPDEAIARPCANCGVHTVYGENEHGEPVVATQHSAGGTLLSSGNEFFHMSGEDWPMCEECFVEMNEMRSPNAEVVTFFGDEPVQFETYSDIVRDRPELGASFAELPDDLTPVARGASTGNVMGDNWYNVSPRSNVDGRLMFEQVREGNVEPSATPVIVVQLRGGRRHRAWFPADNAEAARAAKDLMDGAAAEAV